MKTYILKKYLLLFMILMTGFMYLPFTQVKEVKAVENPYQYDIKNGGKADIPAVGADQINNWSEKKGFEIVSILQKFAQPFCIIMFITGAIVAISGAVFNKKLVPKGIGAMAISGVLYAVILFAPDILDNFVRWVRM